MGTPSGFDLAGAGDVASREDQGTRFEVRDETGDPVQYTRADGTPGPVTITIVGSYSKRYRKAFNRSRERAVKQAARRGLFSGDALEDGQVAVVAACVLAWEGFFDRPVEAGGTPLPCTEENVSKVFTLAPWIRAQAEAVLEDHAAFFGTSSGS